MAIVLDLPAPNAPGGHLLADLDDLARELGGSYPLLAYLLHPVERFEEPAALDPLILAGLVHP
jgi:peptidoglycan/xylan/chitin deacetylase (PgdA/CDA1 family)